MSAIIDCPGCQYGEHAKHDPKWGVIEGLLDGYVCCDCADRFEVRRAEIQKMFTLPGGAE